MAYADTTASSNNNNDNNDDNDDNTNGQGDREPGVIGGNDQGGAIGGDAGAGGATTGGTTAGATVTSGVGAGTTTTNPQNPTNYGSVNKQPSASTSDNEEKNNNLDAYQRSRGNLNQTASNTNQSSQTSERLNKKSESAFRKKSSMNRNQYVKKTNVGKTNTFKNASSKYVYPGSGSNFKWKKMYSKTGRSAGHIEVDSTVYAVTEFEKHFDIQINVKKITIHLTPHFEKNINKIKRYLTGMKHLNYKLTRYYDVDSGAVYYKDVITWYTNRKHNKVLGKSAYFSSRLINNSHHRAIYILEVI
ncbi:hypothetical protein PL11_004325 [Lentilactobacillus curieae]|uniref:Uncharacterized protein n=2 Tax=Lentilactobacillus curieae TaxID=1138822 RepID=A0A1S6QHW7_9LACO|nr:hypothetical protein PL11_004325 [Lentilactobacillus curieae]